MDHSFKNWIGTSVLLGDSQVSANVETIWFKMQKCRNLVQNADLRLSSPKDFDSVNPGGAQESAF